MAEERIFVTSGGIEVPFRPVSEASMKRISKQVETEFREKGEPVDPLTYQVGKDVYEHDQGSIDDPETDQTTRDAWNAHKDAIARMELEQRRRTHRARLIKGVQLEVPDDWAENERLLGAHVPDDAIDLKIAYYEDIFITVDDWKGILKSIVGASLEGAGEDALQTVELLFQRKMGELQGAIAARASSEMEGGGSELVTPSPVPDRPNDEGVGDLE